MISIPILSLYIYVLGEISAIYLYQITIHEQLIIVIDYDFY